MTNDTATGQTWVAIGGAGTVGSIHRVADGFAVKLAKASEFRGVYPSLDIAKSSLVASLKPGTPRPEFHEH